jgi:hypothetical protein
MSDASHDTPPGRHSPLMSFSVIGLMLLMPVLYVASTGPFVWLIERKLISEQTAEYLMFVYLPIIAACEFSPVVEGWLSAYTDLWTP